MKATNVILDELEEFLDKLKETIVKGTNKELILISRYVHCDCEYEKVKSELKLEEKISA